MLKVGIIFLFTRLFYGKYSPRYYFVYKKYVKKSAYRPCYRDSFIAHIENLMEGIIKYQVMRTDQEISFGGFSFGSAINELVKAKGEPYYYTIEPTPRKDFIKAIGYNEYSGQHEIKAVYFFYRNALFMGEYVFPLAGQQYIDSIFRSMGEKYLNNTMPDNSRFIIKDGSDAVIITDNNGFELIVQYYSNTKATENLLKEIYLNYKKSGIGKIKNPGPDFFDKI